MNEVSAGDRDFLFNRKMTAPFGNSVKEAISDINKFLPGVINGTRYLDMLAAHQAVIDIKRNHGLDMSPTVKILLTTNGSITQALQSIQDPGVLIKIRTLNQVIVGLSKEEVNGHIYRGLNVSYGALFNYRKVVLHANDKDLILAMSLTPLCRLNKDFQDDLLRADRPIGSLLEKYKLEVLRRISVIDAVTDYGFFGGVFKTEPGQMIPYRVYDITLHDDILMKIVEFFNPSL